MSVGTLFIYKRNLLSETETGLNMLIDNSIYGAKTRKHVTLGAGS